MEYTVKNMIRLKGKGHPRTGPKDPRASRGIVMKITNNVHYMD
jgi:hypothetical protein